MIHAFVYASLDQVAQRQIDAWKIVAMSAGFLLVVVASIWGGLRPGSGQIGRGIGIAIGGCILLGLLGAANWIATESTDTVKNGGNPGGTPAATVPGGGVGQ